MPNDQVTLYVVSGCPLCVTARRWLDEHGIAYTERNVETDFGALRSMYRLTRQRLVPVLVARGRALVRPGDAEMSEILLS